MSKSAVRTLLVFAAAAIAVVVASAFFINHRSRSIESLVTSARVVGHRTTEARIVGFAHAPYLGVVRGGASDGDSDTERMEMIAKQFIAHLGDAASEAHPRGVAALLAGNVELSLATLAAAVHDHPEDPRIWNDLAAARIERARKHGSAEDLCVALAAVRHALDLNPSMPEAALNRALILDSLQLRELARGAYSAYLAVESDPTWANEGRRRLNAISTTTEKEQWAVAMPRLEAACTAGKAEEAREIVAAFPQQSRSWAEAEYLPRWGDLSKKNDPEATRWLTVARCIGVALQSISGERLLADDVSAIDAAGAGTASEQALANGHVLYRQARIQYSKRDLAPAAENFVKARAELHRSGSPMELVVAHYEGCAAYDRSEYADALAMLDAVAAHTPLEYRSLHAQVDWERSLALSALGRIYEALKVAQHSAADFDALAERANTAQIRTSEATLLASLGRPSDAWQSRVDVFRDASRAGNTALLEKALGSAADDELLGGRWDVATALFREQAELPSSSPRWRTDALVWSALANERVGSHTAGASGLAAARAATLTITDASLRAAALDDIRFADAVMSLSSNPRYAATQLGETILYRTHAGFISRLPEAYVERATALRALGNEAGALSDLNAAIEILQRQPASIEHDLRDSFFGTAQRAFDDAIELNVARGDFNRVFALAERSRSRAVLARIMRSSNTETVSASALQPQLPQGTALIQFTTLPTRSVAVMIDSTHIRGVTLPADRQSLVEIEARLTTAIHDNDPAAFRDTSTRMYDLLIAPFASDLARVNTIIIAADDQIATVPFAALRDSAGRFLIESYVLVMAPSATVYTQLKALPSPPSPRTATASVIADPDFDATRFPTLPRLPGARDEGHAVAELYPGTQALNGANASKSRVLESLPGADIIHLATHAVENDADPLYSAIPLAGDQILYVRDVAELQLSRHPVVVLAACRTATTTARGRGITNFVPAFLAAGSRAVVGSLWNVDDTTSQSFLLGLHRGMRNGKTPVVALRDEQLSMLRSADSAERNPRAWSAFQFYGSS